MLRRRFKDATLLYIFENNLGKEHDSLKYFIKDKNLFDNNVDYLFESHKAIGFHTGTTTKVDAADLLKQVISIGCMSFYEHFFTINAEVLGGAKTMISLLMTQLTNLREYTTEKANGTFRREVTGKHDQNNNELKGRKDDAQMACCMALLYTRKFFDEDLPVNMQAIRDKVFRRQHDNEEPTFLEQELKRKNVRTRAKEADKEAAPLFNKHGAPVADTGAGVVG